jgi:drug/metabolite transporter (DMT)-like permease
MTTGTDIPTCRRDTPADILTTELTGLFFSDISSPDSATINGRRSVGIMLEKQKQAYGYALITILLWSTVASVFKITLRFMTFLQMLFWASLVASIALGLIALFQNKLSLLRNASPRDWGRSALLGLLNPFLYYLILFKAYDLLPAQEAQALNYTWPIMLTLLSILVLKQKIGYLGIGAILISFSGIITVSTHGNILGLHFANPLGAGLALSSSILWAFFWITNIRDHRDEVIKLFLSFSFGFLYTLIFTLLFSELKIPPASGLIGAVYVGLFEMGITFLVWLKALSLSDTTARVGNMVYFSPFLSLLIINVTLREAILPSTIAGLIMIVCGVILQQYATPRIR